MLIAYRKIRGTSLAATDGDIGSIADLFFDGDQWGVRYVVVDTGNWLPGRRVLLPPSLVEQFDWNLGKAVVTLNQQQVKDSPDVDTKQPVSRQMEIEMMKHYGVPYYWGPAGAALAGAPVAMPLSSTVPSNKPREIDEELSSLRSAGEVQGYYIKGTDGDLGHFEDFLIDVQTWSIRYMVIDTKNWLPARKVLIAPEWISSVSWSDALVRVDLTCEQIKSSPEYDPLTPVNRGYEKHLYD